MGRTVFQENWVEKYFMKNGSKSILRKMGRKVFYEKWVKKYFMKNG